MRLGQFSLYSILLAALFSCTSIYSSAQRLPSLHADNVSISEQDKSPYSARVRGYASASPHGVLTTLLRKVPGAADAYNDLVEHFEDAVAEPNCMLRDIDWVEKLKGFATIRGWKAPEIACVSSTRERIKKMKVSASELFRRLQRQGAVVDSIKNEIEEQTTKNFSKVYFSKSFTYAKRYQRCVVERATALRVIAEDGTPLWFVLTGITNANVTTDLADWHRIFVNEYVGVDARGKFHDPLPQYVRPAGPGGEKKNRSDYATTMEMWGGRVGLSGIYNMLVDASPAVVRAIEKGDRDVDQATDALTPSNTAILALPMIMNVVPISLITEVNALGIFIYVLVTDMLTVVPFIIKGFELIAMGNRRQIVEETWFAGRTTDDFVVLELWAAECRIVRVHRIGVIFVSIGFAVLTLGIAAEFIACRLRHKWVRDGTIEAGTAEHLVAFLQNRKVRGVIRKSDVHSGDDLFDPFDEESAFRAQQRSTASS